MRVPNGIRCVAVPESSLGVCVHVTANTSFMFKLRKLTLKRTKIRAFAAIAHDRCYQSKHVQQRKVSTVQVKNSFTSLNVVSQITSASLQIR